MTYQDEFARRLGEREGDGTAVGGPSTGSGRTDEREKRHPELVSGPRTAEPADGGRTDGILSRQAIEDNQVQDDDQCDPASGEPVEPRSCSAPDAEPCGQSTGNSADAQSSASSAEHSRAIRHDGWHPELRVKFLEALARTGNVQAAAYYVQLSRQSAYDLRRRDPDFARAWLAALVLARDVAEDALQERAIDGIEEPVYYHGEVVGTRRRYDSRLLLAHLARLDKIAEQVPAQRGAARFGAMLEAIGKGEDTAPLIATPTEDELAAANAHADAVRGCQAPAEEEPEFYAVRWPDEDSPPEYYRMSAEEAAEMERDVPGLTATPTGTSDDAMITAIVDRTELQLYATGQYGSRRGQPRMNS